MCSSSIKRSFHQDRRSSISRKTFLSRPKVFHQVKPSIRHEVHLSAAQLLVYDGDPEIDVKHVPINTLLENEKDELLYEYDFGDSWLHRIVLEKVVIDREGEFVRPECIDGLRAAPPEDVGGFPGFQEFLKIWRDPDHPEYNEMRRWAGKKYDPDTFDLKKANTMLRMRKKYIWEYDFNINMADIDRERVSDIES